MASVTVADACIVGLGARTPLGLRASTSAVAALAGVSRVQEHPFMRDKAGDPFFVAMDSTLDARGRYPRMFMLAQSALLEVVAGLPRRSEQAALPIYIGLPETPEPSSERTLQDNFCQHLAATVAGLYQPSIVGVPYGNAAGVVALERALAGLHARQFDCCVVGGVDSWIDPDLLEPLDRAGHIASASNRWGFPPGEAAAMMAVCTAAFARQNGLTPLAKIVAVATGVEENRIHTETICVGRGLADVLNSTAAAALEPVDQQYCDIDGQRYREHEFSYAALQLAPERFVDTIAYQAPADRWGHVGAASIPMLAMLPIVAHLRRRPCYRWPMIWSGSNSGLRGAVLLHLEGGAR